MKAIFIGSVFFFFTLFSFSQKVFMYGENGTKVYFQEIDSIIQIKFNKTTGDNEKLKSLKK